MSRTIDNRVVEMGFDNRGFESNVQETVKTLGELKKALNLENAAKGLNDVAIAGSKLDLSNIATGVQSIADRFSTMGIIGMTVIHNLTNAAINAGRMMLDNLVINPARMGFEEYETQINAIQTVLANTETKGTTLVQVNEGLDELNEYADKTIYNFTQMTKNIGTFTAAGIDLETSISAIKGIANLAAVSGSNSQQASTAMYQLSQALSSGTLKLMDWNSVVNAGMGGQVFQEALKETARVHGVKIDAMVKKEGSFRETLKDGWITSAILTETLAKFTGDLSKEELKAIGYTEEQIKSIIRLGEMANDAATKVKTLTQLKDTMAEAIQSGWGQTFRIIVGDFEEAKLLFTSISDFLGEIIGKSSDSRNDLLKTWQRWGGRTHLVEGLMNTMLGLKAVMNTVSAGFAAVFPPITAIQLFRITKAFLFLSEKFKMGAETAEKLTRVFRGIASIFAILYKVVGLLAEGIGILFAKTNITGGGILDLMANIGDSIHTFKDAVLTVENFKAAMIIIGTFLYKVGAQAQEAFWKFVEALRTSEGVKKILSDIKSALVSFGTVAWAVIQQVGLKLGVFGTNLLYTLTVIRDFLVSVWGIIKEVFAGIKKSINELRPPDMTTVFASLDKLEFDFRPMEKISAALTTFSTAVYNAFSGLGEVFGSLWLVAKEGVKKLAETITREFNKINWQEVGSGAGMIGLLGAIFLEIRKAFKTGMPIIQGIKEVLEGVSGTLNEVQKSLKVWQTSIKADIIVKIAMAIGLLALSLMALTLVDPVKLGVAVITVTILFKELMMTMAAFEKISNSGNFASMGKIIGGLIGLSIGIFILTFALRALSDIDSEKVVSGVTAISVMAAALVLAANNLKEHSGDLITTAIGLVIFAGAVVILTEGLARLSELDQDKLGNGLVALSYMIGGVVLFLNKTNMNALSIQKGLGLIVLAGGLYAMTFALSQMAKLKPEEMEKGLKTMGIVLLELGVFMRLAGDPKHMITTAIGVAILAGSLLLLTFPLKALAAIPEETMTAGLVSMAVALGILSIALNTLPADTLAKAVALTIVSGAMLVFTGILATLGKMSLEEISKGLFGIAGVLSFTAVSLKHMNGALKGALALGIVAMALTMFIPALVLLGSLPIEGLLIGIGAIAAMMIVMAVGGRLLNGAAPGLIAFSFALLMMGGAMALAGSGMMWFSIGLAGIIATLYGMGKIIPTVAENLKLAMVAFSQAFVDAAPQVTAAFIVMLLSLLDAAKALIPALINTVLSLIVALFAALAEHTPALVQAGYDILLGLLNGIKNNIADIITVANDIVLEMIGVWTEKLPQFIDAGWKFMIALIDGWTASVDEHMPQFMASVGALAGEIIVGLIQGIVGGLIAFGQAFIELVDGGLKVFTEALGIKSPSTVFEGFGINIVEGLVEGIKARISDFVAIVRQVANDGIAALRGRISGFLTVGRAFAIALINGIKEKIQAVVDKAREMAQGFRTEVEAHFIHIYNLGRDFVMGFVNGINDFIQKAIAKARELVQNVLSGVKEEAESQSPSRKMHELGKWMSVGYAEGIGDYTGQAVTAAENMASQSLNGVKNAISKISDVMNQNMDANPTIRPVMDLSEIVEGSKQINSLVGNKTLSLATSGRLSRMATNVGTPMGDLAGPAGKEGTTVTFTQNNYSPKALSRLEIYRETRNQLTLFKQLVVNT